MGLKNHLQYLLFIILSMSSVVLFGQNDYRFQFVDSETHVNLDSVYVVIPHLDRKYQGDAFGRLTLHSDIMPGDTIAVRRNNYVTKTLPIPHSGDIFIKLKRLPVELGDVEIIAFTQESRRFEAPQTVGTLKAEDFERNSAASIQPTMNTIPGVLMESRGAGGSRRLSIRGSLIRSPFGVRNVKVYWNEFPFTIADGSTGLELIDPEEIGQVDVLKGPQGSIYGEGHGGAVLFQSRMAPYGQLRTSANFQLGSYGMQKQTLSFATSSKKTAIKANYFRYRHEGYRQQEGVRKDQLNLITRFRPESNREIKLFFIYYNGAWGLPGGLDSLTANNSPRSARPFAVANDTRVERKWIRLGISNKIHLNERFYNFSSAFLHSTSKLNPYGTNQFYNGFKDEGANGWGLRSLFGYEMDSEELGVHLMLGGEYQRDLNALAEFDLVEGDLGDLRTSDETRSQYVQAFFKASTHLDRQLVVDGSIGLLTTLYDREDLVADSTQNRDLRRHFEPIWLPKISMRYTLNEQYVIYAIASRGVSTPTLWEIQDGPNLKPERSDHFELGVRGSLFEDLFLITLNGYSTQISDAITEQPDSLGFSTYNNSGVIDLRGLESTIQFQKKHTPERLLTDFNMGINLGVQVYTFEDLQIAQEDFEGNEVPGVPLVNYSVVADLAIRERFTVRTNYRYFDPVPLNNANTAYSVAYGLLDLRIGYLLPIGKHFAVDIYLGSENMLDEEYSSFFRLNANDGRYYNPQAPRTFYGGLQFSFQKSNKLIQ